MVSAEIPGRNPYFYLIIRRAPGRLILRTVRFNCPIFGELKKRLQALVNEGLVYATLNLEQWGYSALKFWFTLNYGICSHQLRK